MKKCSPYLYPVRLNGANRFRGPERGSRPTHVKLHLLDHGPRTSLQIVAPGIKRQTCRRQRRPLCIEILTAVKQP